MATNKRQEFDQDLVRLAEFGRALAHPARVAILKTLARRSTCICGEIVEGMPLAQSTVSQHIKLLKSMGLIRGEVDGPKSCYCIDWEKLNEFSGALREFIDSLPTSAGCDTECC